MEDSISKEELRRIQIKAEKAWKLERVLNELFDFLDGTVITVRVLLYIGSVAWAWFYLRDHGLAVGIVASLTAAHLLVCFREYIQEKKKAMSAP